jgi:hypothetical protein
MFEESISKLRSFGAAPQHGSEDHPSSEQLTAFVGNVLVESERASVFAHLTRCVRCREMLALITPEEGPAAPIALSTGRGWSHRAKSQRRRLPRE